MSEVQVMGALMAMVGGALVAACVFKPRFFVEGPKFRALSRLHRAAPFVLYGTLGGLMAVFGLLAAMGIWRGGFDFRMP